MTFHRSPRSLRSGVALFLFLVFGGSVLPAEARVARRLGDFGAEQPTSAHSSSPRGFLARDGHVLFVANESLWSTDGKPSGTRRVVPQNVAAYFAARDVYRWVDDDVVVFQTNDSRLWSTEGSPESTRPLSLPASGHQAWEVVRFGERIYVSRGSELWSVSLDGEGVLVGNFGLGARPDYLTEWDGGIAFTALRDCQGTQRISVWWTDGTPGGTSPRFCDPNADVVDLERSGSRLLVNTAGGPLWSLDPAGTATVLEEYSTESLASKGLDGRLALISHSNPSRVRVTDGTTAGTRTVIDLSVVAPGSPFISDVLSTTGGLAVFADTLYFEGRTADAPRTLRDLCGTACDDLVIRSGNWNGSVDPFVVRDGTIYFVGEDPAHGAELWRTDGTVAGTGLVVDACPGACGWVPELSEVEGGIVFRVMADDGTTVLWLTDGSIGSAEPLAPAAPGYPSYVSTSWRLAAPDPVRPGRWLYAGFDDLHGAELWSGVGGDGELIADLGEAFAQVSPVATIRPLDGRAWFATCRTEGPQQNFQYWTTGGLPDETAPYDLRPLWCNPQGVENGVAAVSLGDRILVQEANGIFATGGGSPPELLAEGSFILGGRPDTVLDRAYFTLFGTKELWVSDGTPSGTEKAFTFTDNWSVYDAEIVDGDIYLVAQDGDIASRLWTSDGTAAGTRMLIPAGGAPGAFYASRFTREGSRVFFVLNVYDPQVGRVEELWVTEGTEATTRKLKRIQVDYRQESGNLMAWDGSVHLLQSIVDDFAESELTLWSSDGTSEGTVGRVVSERSPIRHPVLLAATPRGLLFAGFTPETGFEPWISDGTEAGTRLLVDRSPGSFSSGPLGWVAFARLPDGRVAFTGSTPAHGRELWISDGTEAGTGPVHDIHPGPAGSDPDQLTVAGDHLYFVADDGLSGRELWAMPLSDQGPTCRADETSICLKGDRFRVEMRWMDFQGRTGEGKAVPLTEDTGYFWFFRPENVEAVLKVLDGRPINGHFWTYYGALSNVEYQTTVTDTATGATHRYFNPLGAFASAGDGKSFGPAGAGIDRIAPFVETGPRTLHAALPSATRRVAATGSCLPAANRLCLNDGRFALEASWTNFEGKTGDATASPLTGDTGTFWFFDDQNVELVVKVLDGTPINGHFWVYYGSLSNVGFVMTVTDTTTGLQKEYRNRIGRFASRGDGTAFPHE